jgi:3-dehydroquinate synthase
VSESFDIASATGSYAVHIQPGGFAAFLAERQNSIIVADEFFASKLPEDSTSTPLFYKALETTKSLDVAPALIEQVRRAGANRQTHFVAVGGGVIQDLTAFAASIYMRGISWSYVPTTILGMVDSCIGGKSSINVGPYKNIVGTFHPPQTVFVDPMFAQTLPLDQQASGIIEAAKICFCHGPASFQAYLSSEARPGMEIGPLTSLVSQSLRAKKWFIEIDEFDRKERLLLNFGHTFGHAIEGASHYGISHGVAVGLGILCALDFVRGGPSPGDPYAGAPIVQQLKDHIDMILRTVPDLASQLSALRVDDAMERFESDKKHKREHYTLILVEPSGLVAITEITKSSGSKQRIQNSIQNIVDSYS